MKNLNDFKVEELEQRLEMGSWCYYYSCHHDHGCPDDGGDNGGDTP